MGMKDGSGAVGLRQDARPDARDAGRTRRTSWKTYAADHTRPLLDIIRTHQGERHPGELVVVVRTKLQATLLGRHLHFPNQVVTLSSFLGECSVEAIRDEDVLPTFVRHQLIKAALPTRLPEMHRHHLAKEVDRALHLLDMHGIDVPDRGADGAIRSAVDDRSGPARASSAGTGRRTRHDDEGAFGALRAGSRAMREAAERFRHDGLFFPGARVTAAAEGRSRIHQRFPSCRTVAFIGIDQVSPRERSAIERVTEPVAEVLWYVIGDPPASDTGSGSTKPGAAAPSTRHVRVGDPANRNPIEAFSRPAFRHTTPLLAWLELRGTVHGHGRDHDQPTSTHGPGSVQTPAEAPPSPQTAAARHPWLLDLFGDRPVAARAAPHVAIHRPRTVDQEVDETIQHVVEALESGTRPEQIALVSPDLATYADRVARHLRRLDVPYAVSLPGRTRDTAAGTFLQILLGALRDGPTHARVFDLADHPLASLRPPSGGAPIDAARWRRLFMERNLRPRSIHQWERALELCREEPGLDLPEPEGAPRSSTRSVGEWTEQQERTLLGWVERIAAARRTVAEGTLTGLFDTLRGLIDDCRLPQGVARAARESDHPSPLIEGYARVLELIDEMEDGFLLLHQAPTDGRPAAADAAPTASMVLDALDEALRSDTLRPTGDPHHGIQILGLRNLRGAVFEQVHLLGCGQRTLPGPDPEDALCRLLETNMGRRFERIDPGHEARFLIHNLLADTRGRVFISCPRTHEDEEVPLSIVIEELLDVIEPAPASTRPERHLTTYAQHAAVARTALHLPDDVLRHQPHLRASMEMVRARTSGDDGSPFTGRILRPEDAAHASPLHAHETSWEAVSGLGIVGPDEAEPPEISVRRLERYATCPQRHLYEHTLGLRGPDARTDDVSPLDRGLLLHAILQHYAHERLIQEPDGFFVCTDADAAPRLYEIAKRLLDTVPDGSLAWQALRYALLSGLDHAENPARDGPPGLLQRFLAHETLHPSRTLAAEVEFGGDSGRIVTLDTPVGTLRLRGRIDRIDAVPSHQMDLVDEDAASPDERGSSADPSQGTNAWDGLRVVDYKTGRPPRAREVAGGTHFQLPLYLHAATRLFPDHVPVSGRYFQLRRPKADEVGWTDDGPDLPPAHRPADLDAAPEGGDDGPDAVVDAARAWTERLLPERIARIHEAALSGAYNLTLLDEDEAGCTHCDHRRICGLRNHLTRDRVHRLVSEGQASTGVTKPGRDGEATGNGAARNHDDAAKDDAAVPPDRSVQSYVPARLWPADDATRAEEGAK